MLAHRIAPIITLSILFASGAEARPFAGVRAALSKARQNRAHKRMAPPNEVRAASAARAMRYADRLIVNDRGLGAVVIRVPNGRRQGVPVTREATLGQLLGEYRDHVQHPLAFTAPLTVASTTLTAAALGGGSEYLGTAFGLGLVAGMVADAIRGVPDPTARALRGHIALAAIARSGANAPTAALKWAREEAAFQHNLTKADRKTIEDTLREEAGTHHVLSTRTQTIEQQRKTRRLAERHETTDGAHPSLKVARAELPRVRDLENKLTSLIDILDAELLRRQAPTPAP